MQSDSTTLVNLQKLDSIRPDFTVRFSLLHLQYDSINQTYVKFAEIFQHRVDSLQKFDQQANNLIHKAPTVIKL